MSAPADSFDPAMLADPTAFAINRMPPRSDHRWFANEDEADRGASSFETLLDGPWKYLHADRPADLPEGLENPETDISSWDEIDVPSHIQLRGYDRPQYVNVQYPWDGHEDIEPGQVPSLFNPVSTYAVDIALPALAEGEGLSFVAEGAESALALWVDGAFIGYATGSFTPCEFDITDCAGPGLHRLVCRVWKWSSGSWLEDQDFFRFSGLFRSVRLLKRPRRHIGHLETSVEFVEGGSDALLKVRAEGPGLDGARLLARLEGAEGTRVEEEAPKGAEREITIRVPNPRLWSAEDPHLYRLRLLVVDESAGGEGRRLLEVVEQSVGIRSIRIEEGLLLINGRPAMLKGVNRHEFGPQGRVPDTELLEKDLIALKRLGVNAIRTSHYPNSRGFYELCDRLGFYVMDEAALETHGIWDRIVRGRANIDEALPGDRRQWLPAVRDRAYSMVRRDRNHPSVIMWSLGNESFGGSVLREVADYLRGLDDRPLHYEGIHWDPRYPETSDIASQMYTSAAQVECYLAEHEDKPFILCEFAHAMGNSFGAVDRYIELMRREAHFQGVFVWDFADQALPIREDNGKEFLGYGGDFGDAPHDGDFCGDGLFFADHRPSPKVQALKALYQAIDIRFDEEGFTVFNGYEVTSTGDFVCETTLTREGVEIGRKRIVVDLAPGGSVHVPNPFETPRESGEYALDVFFLLAEATAWAPAGYEIARGQHVFHVGPERSPFWRGAGVGMRGPLRREGPRGMVLVDSTHNIGVRGDGFEVLFSRIQGGIQSYALGEPGRSRQILRGVPSVNFWHAPTSNERGWGAPMLDGQWLLASRYFTALGGFDPFSLSATQECIEISWALELASKPVSRCELSASIYPDSTLVLSARILPGEGLGDPPEFGFLIPVDPGLRTLRWYGEGPEESTVDRRQGAFLGIYEAEIPSLLTPYLRPQECGSRTGVRWARVLDGEGFGIEVRAEQSMEFSALPVSPFELENALHIDELPAHRRTWLRPVLMRRGVGGDDSWGARVHEEYLLGGRALEFRIALRAFREG